MNECAGLEIDHADVVLHGLGDKHARVVGLADTVADQATGANADALHFARFAVLQLHLDELDLAAQARGERERPASMHGRDRIDDRGAAGSVTSIRS